MVKAQHLLKSSGYFAMITQHAWMFLSSYETLRKELFYKTTVSMAHMGARGFEEIAGEVVQTTAFVKRNSLEKNYKGTYVRLVDIAGQDEKEQAFLSGEHRYAAKQENFQKIPGAPVAYWVSENFVKAFENPKLSKYCEQKTRITTGNNDYFLRRWYETPYPKMLYPRKWVVCPKGGEYRKWHGTLDYVLNWENNGYEIKHYKGASLSDSNYYFKFGLTWTNVSSSKTSFRIAPAGSICDHTGPLLYFVNDENLFYVMGILNSILAETILRVLSPTIHFEWGQISKLPVKMDPSQKPRVESLVRENIELSRADWDAFETSWDFKKHPLL